MKEIVFSILNSIYQIFREHLQNIHNRYVQQQTLQRQYQINALIYDMADQMAFDLYEVFRFHDYHLAPIITVQSFRFYNCRCINGSCYFLFTIDKKTDNAVARCVLSEMRDKMNRDIISTQRKFAYLYGPEYVYANYPFLYYGISIAAIQDIRLSEVLITVQTNLTPQEFEKIYRQT